MKLISEDLKEKVKGENCFDFLRYFFALFLIVVHYCTLAGIDTILLRWGNIRVKAFFIISGFLVFYSFINQPDLNLYVDKRLRRIVPPYVLVVFACFLLGSLITNLSFKDYFLSFDTYRYLLANFSFMNFIEPSLPGVFDSANMYNSAVNGSLWTMKVEIMFYISVPLVYFFLKRYNKFNVILFVFIFVFIYEFIFSFLYEKTGSELYRLIKSQITQFKYFYSGTLILLYFDKFLKYLKYLFPIALVVFIFRNKLMLFSVLEPLGFATLIIGSAYSLKFLNFFRNYDNISYGMYLFHYPIVQCFVFYGYTERYPVLSFCAVLCITLIISFLSWKYVEKPIIKKVYF